MALGDVLRGLGSVLNPQVAQDLGREDLQANEMLKQLALQSRATADRRDDRAFTANENAKSLAAKSQMHMEEIKQRGLQRMQEIAYQVQEGRISKEEADKRAAALKSETQQALFSHQEYMAKLVAGMRQPPQPQLVTNDQGVFQVDRSGQAVPVTGPDGKPLPGKPSAPEKAMPASAAKGLLENQQNLRRAEQALALIEGKDLGEMKGDKNATGWKGFTPDAILQRTDPKGIDARAALADLGSLVIHDRSGAAVTAAEFPRLRPFIPQVTDDPATVKKKLARFAQVYKEVVDDTREFYKASGYKVPDSTVGAKKTVNFGDLD